MAAFQQPPRSLLAVDNSEPLPLYTPRQFAPSDLETASVHSSAPSYVSAAPSYHSSVPPSHAHAVDTPQHHTHNESVQHTSSRPTQSSSNTAPAASAPRQGLRPAPQFAAGFGNRVTNAGPSSSRTPSDLLTTPGNLRSLYNISEWVPATEGLQSRHYHNVAKRRVSEALSSQRSDATRTAFPWLSALLEADAARSDALANVAARRNTVPVITEHRGDSIERGFASSPVNLVENPNVNAATRPRSLSPVQLAGSHDGGLAQDLDELLPLSPHEDPDLVGEEAAARFRSQRLYRTYQQHANLIQQPQTGTGQDGAARPQPQPLRPHQYTSLIPPDTLTTTTTTTVGNSPSSPSSRDRSHTASPPAARLNRTLRSNDDSVVQRRSVEPLPTIPLYERATTASEFEEALRDHESRTWDFLLAQMADSEVRQRDWKRFKEDVDRRLASRTGLLWRGKLRRGQDRQSNGSKKWKNKVGLGT